ncbi:tyrosine kinase family protein [Acinetobacter baumannii 1437282]|nr:tyrosine kinase family protein [Acinetobacter baumannii 1437282]
MEIQIVKDILTGLGESEFLNKYDLVEKLNQGGNSHSYKAHSHALNKFVFVKFFLLPRHEVEILKFKNEIAIHKLISRQGAAYDENAVIDYIESDLFKDDLGGYLVLEWLEGRSLDEVIDEYADKSIDEKVQLFHRVANALIPLSTRVDHRDLHPSNIMVLDEPFEYEQLRDSPFNTKIKIVDFGESYSTYVTVVSDLELEDVMKIYNSNSRRLTTSLYSTPPEFLKKYRGNDGHVLDKAWNYDSWALGLIGFKIFFNEDLLKIKDIKDYVSRVYSNRLKYDISHKISQKFYSFQHRQSKVLEHIFYSLLQVDPARRSSDGEVGLAIYLINFKNYQLSQNLESSEYYDFIQNGYYYLDRKGLTNPEDEWDPY